MYTSRNSNVQFFLNSKRPKCYRFWCVFLLLILFMNTTITAKTVLVCVGNSITEQYLYDVNGIEFSKITGFVKILADTLGSDYEVKNFGIGGVTMCKKGDLPYWDEEMFKEVFNVKPDIITLMLGTNDAQSNIYGGIDNFSSDYKELINDYQSLPTNPQIWLVVPPPIYENKEYWDNMILEQQVIPQIKQVASELDLPTIDVNTALTDYPQYFGDGIHPNTEGASIITETIYEAISFPG